MDLDPEHAAVNLIKKSRLDIVCFQTEEHTTIYKPESN